MRRRSFLFGLGGALIPAHRSSLGLGRASRAGIPMTDGEMEEWFLRLRANCPEIRWWRAW